MKLNDLFFFVQVVDKGGFAAAARALHLPKSSISKRIAELERDLGVRLIHRTTRSFAVTDVGRDFYQHAAAAIAQAEEAEGVVRLRLSEPRGLVRITASMTTVQIALGGLLPELAKQYPKVTLSLSTTDRFVDMVEEGIDVAVRSHRFPLADSGNIRRRVGYAPNYLVAAPSYLACRAMPATAPELAGHDAILSHHQPEDSRWTLSDDHGLVAEVKPRPVFFAADPVTSLKAALSGLGIANLPHGLCWPALQRGELVRVLPQWSAGGAETTILTPHRSGRLPAVRVVIDFLAAGLRQFSVSG